jgi:hypothetical protein
MLAMKAWLETRWKVLYAVVMVTAMFALARSGASSTPQKMQNGMPAVAFITIFVGVFLAGAGIATQPAFRDMKGAQGSVYFTLSMPVTRFRLFAERVGIGLLEFASVNAVTYCLAWFLFPPIRGSSNGIDLVEWILAASVCTVCFYFLSVLLATFLDQTGQMFGGMFAAGVTLWLVMRFHLGLFDFAGAASPLVTHHMPWMPMAISVILAAILCMAAWKIVDSREY